MKRSIPLLITALGGFVLIFAYFIPVTQGWGEVAAIWFDILAAIAFILGGGNLIKIQLKKVSNKDSGWGYAALVLISFLTMLYVGLVKWGAPPAPNQEFFGKTFAHLPIDSIPNSLVFEIEGSIPKKAVDGELPANVRRQLFEENEKIKFRGWMLPGQKAKLLEYKDQLQWQCNITKLFQNSQPTGPLGGRVAYYADHNALSFSGHMTDEHKNVLIALNGDEKWVAAVNQLFDNSQGTITVEVSLTPPFLEGNLPEDVSYDLTSSSLSVTGQMSPAQRDGLADLFPIARPISGNARDMLLLHIKTLGHITDEQIATFNKSLDGIWKPSQVLSALNEAGKVQEVDRTVCEMYQDQVDGISAPIPLKKSDGENFSINDSQRAIIEAFAAEESMQVKTLIRELIANGDFKSNQKSTLNSFLSALPSTGEMKKMLCFQLMKTKDQDGRRIGLNKDQQDFLLADYRDQIEWRKSVGELFVAAHVVKYKWSGEYRAQGSPFWWLYEYAMKPLQATIFAMLAFYVASAAFRAFRAKNVEATLLLGTAFIILLGRTAAGVALTAWVPESLAGFKIENMTVYIMQVFNTAGNRAIMIGIALGIASTSLKVLLGVDRSYLGSGEE